MNKPVTGLIDIVVPLPLDTPLTYSMPPDLHVAPAKGVRVLVPVGAREMVGVVWGNASSAPSFKTRQIKGILDENPLLPDSMRPFFEWVASYYFYPLGQLISEALPPGFLSAKSRRIVQISRPPRGLRASFPEIHAWPEPTPAALTGEQKKALSVISESLGSGAYHSILLHGVTGSGKTEVYLRAAEECLNLGKSVLVLVPEIAMTAQIVGRFAGRFGDEVTVLHSGLTEAQRRYQWWRIRRGESRIAIGTRSAIFAPLSDIGLIVVDEEHDPSYKQEEKLRYHARDLAVLRAHMGQAVVLLGSATPSFSSYRKALEGRYGLLTMKRRVEGRSLPEVQIIDRRGEKKARRGCEGDRLPGWLSEQLRNGIEETLGKAEQVLLFLNRRGFATYVFCRECGYVFKCPDCDVSLTWHRSGVNSVKGSGAAGTAGEGRLLCHYCGNESPAAPLCPRCRGGAVKASGWGTERISRDMERLFPGVRVGRLDRDTAVRRRKTDQLLRDFHAGTLDVLVGTQMVTKGHDFPRLTLVGILVADLSLHVPEFHASERTFQLLAQVAGRAGRGARPGRVMIQTMLPEHFVFRHVKENDYRGCYETEVRLRSALGYPPFGRLINFRFTGRNSDSVERASRRFTELAGRSMPLRSGKSPTVEILGPAPAPRAKLRKQYRWQVMLKSRSLAALRAVSSELMARKKDFVPPGVRFEVDVDPLSVL